MTLYGEALKTVTITSFSSVEAPANTTRQERKMILKACKKKENWSVLRLR